MSYCTKKHRYWDRFNLLPDDQGGFGRHKCAGCAYDVGYKAGINRIEYININLEEFPLSQAGTIRHKSPHAAFAEGYRDGIEASYK